MLKTQDLSTDKLLDRAGLLDGIASLDMPRANVNLGVQFAQGSVNAAAPTGTAAWFGLKAQSNMQGPWLALVQLLPIAGSPGLVQGVLQLNTPGLVALMHADPADTTPELLTLPVYGQFFYFAGGAATPNTSQIITVNVTAVLWNGAEGLAPNPNAVYPTAAAMATAVAQAAAAEPGLGNPSADGMVLSSTQAGVRSWKAPTGAVQSVNGKTGVVNLAAADVGAAPASGSPNYDPAGAAAAAAAPKAAKLAIGAIQTASGALVADTLVPFDCTAGNLVATMPASPAAGTRVSLKKVDATANTLSLTAPFDGATAASTLTLRLQNYGKTFVYDGTSWWAVYGDLSLPTLDARFDAKLSVSSAAYAATLTPAVGSAGANTILNVGALTGPLAMAAPSGTPSDGQVLTFRLTQDATGGRVVTWDPVYLFAQGVSPSAQPQSGGAQYEMTFRYHATTSRWRYLGGVGPF